MNIQKVRVSLRFLLFLIAILGLVAACARKVPESTPESPVTTNTPSVSHSGAWAPEHTATPTLKVQNNADAYNKQHVLKTIHFDTDKWNIRPADRLVLKENAAWLLAHPSLTVIVQGHCDERNTQAYNLALGERRANAAKEYLIGMGVSANSIHTVSYGKTHPLCTEHNETCWQRNRRDAFVLQDMK